MTRREFAALCVTGLLGGTIIANRAPAPPFTLSRCKRRMPPECFQCKDDAPKHRCIGSMLSGGFCSWCHKPDPTKPWPTGKAA